MTIFYGVEFFYGVSVNSFYFGEGGYNYKTDLLSVVFLIDLRGGEIKGLSLF